MKYGITEFLGLSLSGYDPDQTFDSKEEAFEAAVNLIQESGADEEIEMWVGTLDDDGNINQDITIKVTHFEC